MKVMIKVFSIFAFLMMVVSCATTPNALPEKNDLYNDLEAVDEISKFKVQSWEKVNSQSIMLKVNWNDYYLLVLRRPIDARYSDLSIGISTTVSIIAAGFDRVIAKDPTGTQYYVIDKIYKLKGKEQADEIKERLRK